MKPADVKASAYINFDKENKDKDPKFIVSDHVRLAKYNFFLPNATLQIDLQKFFFIKKVKHCAVDIGHTLSVVLMMKKLLKNFTWKNCKQQIKKSLELKKFSKEKSDELYVKGSL